MRSCNEDDYIYIYIANTCIFKQRHRNTQFSGSIFIRSSHDKSIIIFQGSLLSVPFAKGHSIQAQTNQKPNYA